jgi:cell wall-associated NlpC family hydrolase
MIGSAKARAVCCGLAACAVLSGCGSSNSRSVGSSATASSRVGIAAGPAVGTPSAKHAGAAHLVADPKEASSFPAPPSTHHAAAAAPAKAGDALIAAGAPSDAEVKAELQQMQAVEKSAKQARHARLTPVPGGQSIGGNGTIPIPTDVPEVVQKVVAGANEIADFPYVFGGGHASFIDNAYDCSGSVSYALAAGGLLAAPETSGELESWGVPGPGRYITVYANAGHTYMYVDGILFDTAGRSGVYASRWLVTGTDNSGFVVRHYPGL